MATYTSTSGRYTTTLTITQGTQNIATNSSVVNWSLSVLSDGGTIYHWDDTCPWNVKINGTTVDSGTFSYDLRSGGTQTVMSRSGTTTVVHDNDGTKTVSVSAYVDMDNPSFVSPMTASGNFTLTTIPRASDVSVASSYTIANTTGSLSATISPKASFYHRWKWTVGSYTSNWTTLGQSSSSQTISVTNTNLLARLPTSASGSITFTVETHNGSAYSSSTLVGSSTATSTLAITLTAIKPTLSYSTIAVDSSSPISGYAIRGYSTLKVTSVSSTGGSGTNALTVTATISGISGATMATKTLSSASGSNTISNGTMTSNTLPAGTSNVSSGTVKFSLTATDSRGASTTVEKTYSATVYGYTPPVVTLNAYRVNSSSSTKPDGAGAWVYVASCTATRGSSINNQNSIVTGNSATRAVVTLGSTTTTYTTLSSVHQKWFSLAITSSGSIVLYAKDTVGGTAQAQVSIGNATYPIILRDNGSGVVGVGIGMFPEANVLNSSLIMKVNASSANVETKDTNNNGNCFIGWGAGHQNHGVYSYGYSPDGTSWTADGKWIAYRNSTGDIILNGNADTATSATNADYIYKTATNPTSQTSYDVLFCATGSTGYDYRVRDNNGLQYSTLEGTADTVGVAQLRIGNNTSSGTAGNKKGQILFWTNTNLYVQVLTRDNNLGNRTLYIPVLPANSDFATTATISSNQTLKGGGNSLTLTNGAYYRRLRVYAYYAAYGYTTWEIDVAKITTTASHFNHSCPVYVSDPGDWYLTIFEVTCTKSGNNVSLTLANVYNKRIGTSGQSTQNNSSNYYIYQVDGLM